MHLFDAIFQHQRESPAIIYEGREISYADLAERTRSMSAAIAAVGIQRGDRVALLLNDSPEFIEAFVAICSMGAIAVPINTALTLEDQRAIIHNCRARVAIIENQFCETLLTNAPPELHFPEQILTVDRTLQSVQSENAGNQFYVTDETIRQPHTRINPLDYLRNNPRPTFSSNDEDEVAFILYTSGSTGEPKGAMHSQADIFHTNEGFCRQVLQLTNRDRLFSSSRLPFAYGLGNSFSFPLLNGATSVLCREKPTPEIISRTLKDARPTIFFAVPVVYSLLLEYHEKQPLDCSSLRMCVSAGEALPTHLGERWQKTFGVPVLDGIGSTEMLHMFMSNKLNDVCYGSSGKILAGYEARLLDEHGEPSAEGAEGNLWIKGSSAASGYWERPEETERTFVDGWVRTGDLYRCDETGHWFHMGRSDDCFKSSGQWVSPVEVEGVLLRHANVARAAVVEDFDQDSLPCACAFVVSHNAESDTGSLETELRSLAASALHKFKQPQWYVLEKEYTYTATSNIMRI